ncbi:cupin domain-containing protein [Ornatilinea apprima]|uniref:cupin domain-containing protein n=1 Tax=Ornatilinea apprima TaxID=1134406 RepID=UPI0009E8A195|nr:cupin domain-containing protein [Ornatilinea apprima]
MSSAVHHFNGTDTEFNWEGAVPKQIPADDTAKYATGKVVIGGQDGAENFVFRYFCVQPGGNSTMPDQHVHDHGIYFLHGKGEVTLNGVVYPVQARDMVYIAPNDVHGIINTGDEPLGFICVIPAKERLQEYLKLTGKSA